MKKVVLLLTVILMSASLMGQIDHPKNEFYHKYFIEYNDDKSISFSYDNKISQNQLPELIKIFEIADKLKNYCEQNSDVIIKTIEKEIGVINGKTFIFHNDVSENKSYILIRPLSSFLISPDNETETFIALLTTIRDQYYKDLEAYNAKKNQLDSELDKIIGR